MNSGFNKRFYCINYFKIFLTVIFLNIFNIYSGSSCNKCKTCFAKLCQGEKKDPSDNEILELKDFLFGVLFHNVKGNFVFHDYITITKLEDKKILDKIDKKGSNDVYVLNVDLNNKIFSDESKVLDDDDYAKNSLENRTFLKFSKKQYEEDKNNNKYTYLRDGRIDSKKYGTVIYYIESGKLCIYCKNVKDKLYKKDDKGKTTFVYQGTNVDIKDCEVTNYIENNQIVDKTKQITPIIQVESPIQNKVVMTFYKRKSN